MRRGFIPVRDAQLRDWAICLSATVLADPDAFGVAAEELGPFTLATNAFVDEMTRMTPGDRSQLMVFKKDQARLALEAEARKINDLIRGRGVASDAALLSIGLTVRKTRYRRIEPPTEQPLVRVRSVGAPLISLIVKPTGTARIALPDDVAALAIYHWVGDDVPADLERWTIAAQVSRCRVSLPIETTPGTKVHFAAYYLNRRDERGPWGPITTTHALGGVMGASLAA